jgi:hypothetical protein
MNYLVIEGYKEAAESFQPKHKTKPDLSSIEDRMLIRSAIQSGDIPQAITRINDFDPEILDSTPRIFFHLLMQRMIEAIRRDRWEEALRMAQGELGVVAAESEEYLREFEDVMLLMAFDVRDKENPGKDLLSPAQRMKTANEVNVALLASQGHQEGTVDASFLFLLRISNTCTCSNTKMDTSKTCNKDCLPKDHRLC